MALIKCKECGKEISDISETCIHCGCPIEKELTCSERSKEKLTKEIININNIPILIIVVLGVIFILIVANTNDHNSILGTYVQDGGVGTTLIIEKNNNCSMVVPEQDDEYPSTISNCHWSMSDNQITINYTMSMSSAYVQNYTRDGTLSGTFKGDYIEMDAGAIYYKK